MSHLDVYHASLTLLMAYALGWPDGTVDPRDVPRDGWRCRRPRTIPRPGTTGSGPGVADVNATEIVATDRLTVEADRKLAGPGLRERVPGPIDEAEPVVGHRQLPRPQPFCCRARS